MKDASQLTYGCLFQNPYTTFSSFAVNSATASIGHSFWCPSAKNLSKIGLRILGKTGTINYGEIEVKVYPVDTNTGYPNLTNLLGTTTATSTGSYAYGVNYMTFVFASPIALSANTQYCFLYRNLNATPASNYFTAEYSAITRLVDASSATNQCQECAIRSTNDSTWTRSAYGGNWFVTFDDDTSLGLPLVYAAGQSAGQTYMTFKTPKFRIRLNCFRTLFYRSGTYTNTSILRLKNISGTTIADSKNFYNFAQYPTSYAPVPFYFDDVVLEANTVYIIEIVYTSGTEAGITALTFATIFPCDDYLNLRKQFTGEETEGYPNGSKANLSYCCPFAIFGEIDEPVQYQQHVSFAA